jgi:hypothetical protein
MVSKVEEFKIDEEKSSVSKKAQTLIKGKQPPKKSETNQILGIEGFYYLTERILMCPFPGNPSEVCQDDKNDEEADNTLITKIADYLNSKHQSHYLVYNLSEYKYDYSFFNQSVSRQQKRYIKSYVGDGVQLPWSPMSAPRHAVHDLHLDPVLAADRPLPRGGASLPGNTSPKRLTRLLLPRILS